MQDGIEQAYRDSIDIDYAYLEGTLNGWLGNYRQRIRDKFSESITRERDEFLARARQAGDSPNEDIETSGG